MQHTTTTLTNLFTSSTDTKDTPLPLCLDNWWYAFGEFIIAVALSGYTAILVNIFSTLAMP